MTNDKTALDACRQEFEKWVTDNNNYSYLKHKNFGGTYLNDDVCFQWDAWKAAWNTRAALAPVDVEGLKIDGTDVGSCFDVSVLTTSDIYENGWNDCIDHLAARGCFGVPEGYALVPIEPTDEILNAMAEQCDGYNENYYFDIYKAMIKAAPKKEGM